MTEQDTWREWSKHVLLELERLNAGQDDIKRELQGMRGGMAKVVVLDEQVKDIKAWQNKVKEVCSTTQLSEMRCKVHKLDEFKTRAITIFAVIQLAVTIALAAIGIG